MVSTLGINSSMVQQLVTLQRPLPVISSLRPGRSIRSAIKTCRFGSFSAVRMPAISPAAPAPIIRTVRALLWLFFIDCRFLHLFIDVVLIPDALQLGIGLADLILLF